MNFTLRQSQALSTFGVGAIVDYNQQSLMPTYLWARTRPEGLGSPIEENYLLRQLQNSVPSRPPRLALTSGPAVTAPVGEGADGTVWGFAIASAE